MRISAALLSLLAAGTLHAQTTLYWGGGTSNIGNGTALGNTTASLNGTWSDTVQNWSSTNNGVAGFTGTVFQAWSPGAFANLGYYTDAANTVITVSGNKSLSGMFASMSATSGSSRAYQFNGAAANTVLNLGTSGSSFLIASSDISRGVTIGSSTTPTSGISIAGSGPLIKDGGGSLSFGNFGGTFYGSDAFTGPVIIRSGAFTVNPSSSMNGVTNYLVTGYRPSINQTDANANQGFTASSLTFNFANATTDRINNSANITLTRGSFTPRSQGTAGNETMSSIIFQGSGGIVNSQTDPLGSVLNIASLSRGSDGRGTGVVLIAANGTETYTLRITSPGGDAPADTLLPWLSNNRGQWMFIDSTDNNRLKSVASVNTSGSIAAWHTTYNATTNLRIDGGTPSGTLGGNTILNALGINATGASTLDLGTFTLTLNSGALGTSGGGGLAAINGGTITSNSTALYINSGWTGAANGITINSTLAGNMDIYYTGHNTLTLAGSAGANTYNGTMYINAGTVAANRAGAINGNVVIGTGGALSIGNSGALASGANVTMAKDSLLYVGSNPTISGSLINNGGVMNLAGGSLTVNGTGTGFQFNGGIMSSNSTAARSLNLLTNLSYAATSDTQAVIQNTGSAALTANLSTGGAATRTFNIADSTLHNKAEMLIDVPIVNGNGTSPVGSLVKEGAGVLQLTANNTYNGTTTVNGGTLHLARIQASAQSGLAGAFTNQGVDSHILTFTAPITGNMAVGQTVSGTGIVSGRVITSILNDYQVILNGNVGNAATPTSATDIALGAVDRAGQLASAVTVNNSGTLLLDTGTQVNNTVTVNSGGVLAGTGTITGATVISGSLRPGHSIGTLTVNNNVTWNAGNAWVFELGTASANLTLAFSSNNTQDLLMINSGNFTKGTGSTFTFDFAGTGSMGWYKLVDWTGSTTFSASDFSATNLSSGLSGEFTVDSGTSALYLNVIPEPAAAALIAVGLGGLALSHRRRRNRT